MTSPDIPFSAYLQDFIVAALGYPLPPLPFADADWSGLSGDAVERRSLGFKNKGLPEMLAWETRAVRRARQQRAEAEQDLAATLAEAAMALSSERLEQSYAIAPNAYSALPDTGDFIYLKINHGFWEQVFMISHDGYVAEMMRPTARVRFLDSYANPRFIEALELAIRRAARSADGALSFPGLEFGFSFGSGDRWHGHWLNSRIWETDGQAALVTRGVFGGSQLFFSRFGDGLRLQFADGAYPKQALFDGRLSRLIGDAAQRSDRVVFCVPPHLAGIRLSDCSDTPQEILHVSGRMVHPAWPLTLAGVGTPILQRLAAGETVTVIVQAAVVSALLGLYLQQAKTDLGLPGRLIYLDLGQVLDAASPQEGGNWISKGGISQNLTGLEQLPFRVDPVGR